VVYRETFRELHGVEATAPIVGTWAYVDDDPDWAQEFGKRYIGGYYESVLRQYQIEQEGFWNAKCYEYYKKLSAAMRRDGGGSAIEFFASLQAYGTPEQVLGTIRNIQSQIGNDSTVHVFSYGGMSYDDAECSMRLFTEKVQPDLIRSASRRRRISASSICSMRTRRIHAASLHPLKEARHAQQH